LVRDVVVNAILEAAKIHFPNANFTHRDLQKIKLNTGRKSDLAIIKAAWNVSPREICDSDLSKFNTANDLVDFVTKPIELAGGKGIPLIEIFGGIQPSSNISLINYRKKRWSDVEHRNFLLSALKGTGLWQSANFNGRREDESDLGSIFGPSHIDLP
jgi:hypothetical protein